jgi:hypothetical protein
VTPILQGIQGRRTGLIIGKRISKDSDGFEDIDAFWDIASGMCGGMWHVFCLRVFVCVRFE